MSLDELKSIRDQTWKQSVSSAAVDDFATSSGGCFRLDFRLFDDFSRRFLFSGVVVSLGLVTSPDTTHDSGCCVLLAGVDAQTMVA